MTATQPPFNDEAAEKALGALLYAVVKGLTDAGLSPQKAMRLAAFVAIDGAIGRGALRSLGLPAPTERRWRAEVREALSGVELPDEPPVEYMNELLPLMGIRGIEVRRKDDDG